VPGALTSRAIPLERRGLGNYAPSHALSSVWTRGLNRSSGDGIRL